MRDCGDRPSSNANERRPTIKMHIDLHTHSVSSDDSRATVEQYVKWVAVLRGKGYQIDGFVLTEHRKFDFDADYRELAAEHEVVILKGSELDTDMGHFLVYGVNEELARRIDFGNVRTAALKLVAAAEDTGAIAIPAHPGRFGIGLCEFADNGLDLSALRAGELLNGSNRPGEQDRAEELLTRLRLAGTGGSDAHLVSAIGKCMTQFPATVSSESELVEGLKKGGFRPVRLDQTL